MRPNRITDLRHETVDMFYHGFDNYMRVAFPEDELRPVSCIPLARDSQNPRNFELNDVLGNYSLTLIDSLSTLAILASAPPDARGTGPKALSDFQDGIAALVRQYGDGKPGPSGQGIRGRGFDVDSKVQVFETVIRGVGGLLSAHLFAIGELPIAGYEPDPKADGINSQLISWPNGFHYDGQLLRLALDLAQRLLPAFYTTTGLPYPRVNLRHGIPFYANSPLHGRTGAAQPNPTADAEITETCSAGAGSLVLEFTVLSRLTGDHRFEQAAKRAFWAVWERRSSIGLIGAGVDAERGHWIGSYAGIGAGADSFFEYALKTHILLSGQELPSNTTHSRTALTGQAGGWLDPNDIYTPLSAQDNSPEAFLQAWHDAHSAIKRHLYTKAQHPHYVNANLVTGSPQAFWIDSLGAYYAGLLTLAGEVEEAIETHLLYAALWTRFSALPERWSLRENNVEGGLGWWPGRPEFIESTYYLYCATKDPWYLYVGEMVLRDISRRCRSECGWSGLQDVRTGEKSDRMESFFLGETAKYLYLLFDEEHPLNRLDSPFVFTTEGHPLVIPRRRSKYDSSSRQEAASTVYGPEEAPRRDTCPAPPTSTPISGSLITSRPDIYHASRLVGLHHVPNMNIGYGDNEVHFAANPSSEKSKMNHTFFPWTLPTSLIPSNGTCTKPPMPHTLLIEFPSSPQQGGSAFNHIFGAQGLSRIPNEGILVQNLSGLKLTLLLDETQWRVVNIGGLNLGRDEKVFFARDTIGDLTDPLFTKVREVSLVDLALQVPKLVESAVRNANKSTDGLVEDGPSFEAAEDDDLHIELFAEGETDQGALPEYRSIISSLLRALRDPSPTKESEEGEKATAWSSRSHSQHNSELNEPVQYQYISILGITPTGIGASSVPDVKEAPNLLARQLASEQDDILSFSWTSVYAAGQACDRRLPDAAAKKHQVIIMRRGGCTFSEKLTNIPSFVPGSNSLQMVLVVSDDIEVDMLTGETRLVMPGEIRPLLDQVQYTPNGIARRSPLSMLMVHGGDEAYDLLAQAVSIGMRRRYVIESQGMVVNNIVIL